jgi:triosephosphate isomerase
MMTTPSRSAIIAGNWKMHYGPKQASHFAREIVPGIEPGAQNMFFEEKGAFTGEISPNMVRE